MSGIEADRTTYYGCLWLTFVDSEIQCDECPLEPDCQEECCKLYEEPSAVLLLRMAYAFWVSMSGDRGGPAE